MFSEGHQFNLYSVLCYFYTEIPTILLLVFFIYNQNNKTSIPVVEIQMCDAAKSFITGRTHNVSEKSKLRGREVMSQ